VVAWLIDDTGIRRMRHREHEFLIPPVAKVHTMCYIRCMTYFDWNPDKNEWLRVTREITFEEIVFHISRGDLLDVLEHPNASRYPGQKIFVVDVEGYVCLVPFV